MSSKYVRLKPRKINRKAHKLRSYTVFGIKFTEERGWYQVDDDVAAYCKTVKQVQEGGDKEFSANAFDVVNTLAEAKAIDEAEKKQAERATAENAHTTNVHRTAARRPASLPGTLTTTDLAGEAPAPAKTRKGDGFDEQDDTFPDDGADMAPRVRQVAPIADGADEVEQEEPAAPAHDTTPPRPNKKKARSAAA